MQRPRFDSCRAATELVAASPHFNSNCWLARRRNRDGSWSVNFRFREVAADGTRRQKSINLDRDPILVSGAQEAVALRRYTLAQGRAKLAVITARRRRIRAIEEEVMTHITGSRRYRQAVRRTFRERCATDPLPTAQEFLAGLDGLKLKRRRAGRPLKRRLW